MTNLEKVFYGLLLSLAISFGSLVYHNAIARIGTLETHAAELKNEVKERIVTDAVAIAEIRRDIKYLVEIVARIDRKLDVVPPPPKQRPPRPSSIESP